MREQLERSIRADAWSNLNARDLIATSVSSGRSVGE
jgi:hypothetical protein